MIYIIKILYKNIYQNMHVEETRYFNNYFHKYIFIK